MASICTLVFTIITSRSWLRFFLTEGLGVNPHKLTTLSICRRIERLAKCCGQYFGRLFDASGERPLLAESDRPKMTTFNLKQSVHKVNSGQSQRAPKHRVSPFGCRSTFASYRHAFGIAHDTHFGTLFSWARWNLESG